MSTVLHIQASPRGDESFSNRLARRFLDELRKHDPALRIDRLDVFAENLPDFAAPAAKAKYAVMAGKTPADEAERAWEALMPYIDRLKSADKVVLSAPMWNFGNPYRLKQWFDLVSQPGLTFRYSPEEGYVGLVTGKPLALLLARGGDYSLESGAAAYDKQLPYLRDQFAFIGFGQPSTIFVQPSLQAGPDVAAAKLEAAYAEAAKLAQVF